MCKKTRPGPTQTRKKALPPTLEHSLSKITKYEKVNKRDPKRDQRQTLDAAKTHVFLATMNYFIDLSRFFGLEVFILYL